MLRRPRIVPASPRYLVGEIVGGGILGGSAGGRLRLLRQIGDELVPGVEQFLLVDDVVAVEDGAALVAGQGIVA